MTPADSFVRVRGAHFERAGDRYCFGGVNLWYAAYLALSGRDADRARLGRELDRLQQCGVTNLRLLAGSEPTPHAPITPVFQPQPGAYHEPLLQGLDYVVAELGRRGMHAVLYLTNQWEWSGGMATYVEWITGETRPPANRWPDTLRFDVRFFSLPAARALYLAYVRMLARRVNTVTGRAYADDPAIMAWQLANEPRAGDAGDLARVGPDLLSWADEASQLLRSLAPRQLISTGSEGTIGTGGDADFCRRLHALPAIDYLTAHIWPFNWHWYRPAESATTLPVAMARTQVYLDAHLALAHEVGKPLVVEEFGLPRDAGRLGPGTPTTARDTYLDSIFARFRAEVAAGGPLAGINLWSWSGEGTPVDPNGARWQPGTALCGDNGVEPQGLNSIYASDHSTLGLLAALNRDLGAAARPRATAPSP